MEQVLDVMSSLDLARIAARAARMLGLVGLAVSAIGASAGQSGRAATAKLTIEPVALNWAKTLRMGAGFNPANIQLKPQKPAGIKREPSYRAEPLYGVLRVGNGHHSGRRRNRRPF